MRINVIGTSGSGKTTYGKKLAETLSISFLELDAIFWGPEWGFPTDEVFFPRLSSALEGDNWVLDGNYSRTLPIKWERVQSVIWLDFTFARTLYQAVTRAIPRLFSQEELWPGTGNRESIKMLLSRDSIVLWTIKTYRRRRTKILGYMKEEKFSQIRFHRLGSPREAEDFLQKIRMNPSLLTGKSNQK
ncbi:MAG: hypothetical protein MUO54_11680 [Anaerolineales bacterium]|nr:hypothetical protein [Anaerolineales bacterium]